MIYMMDRNISELCPVLQTDMVLQTVLVLVLPVTEGTYGCRNCHVLAHDVSHQVALASGSLPTLSTAVVLVTMVHHQGRYLLSQHV